MLGFRYVKNSPTTYSFVYRNGKLRKRGDGQSIWYFVPTTTIVSVNLASIDAPFLFEEMTADFQDVTVQGQLTFRVADPETLSKVLDHTVDAKGRYISDDPTKIEERLIQATQVTCRDFTRSKSLQEMLMQADQLAQELRSKLRSSQTVGMLGLEILDVNLLSIKATPEMAKAMQADARERLLLKADEAVYARRNVAIDLERKISESQLLSEKVVEEKKREVRQAQMEAEIAVESQRAQLVEQQVANEEKLSKARAAALTAIMESVRSVDWRTLAATLGTMDSKQTMAMAFQQLAENADKVSQLQITPDLLQTLMNSAPGPNTRK
jgi:regulator of protease activity HflC (stomatin/prohibitin superfamily)